MRRQAIAALLAVLVGAVANGALLPERADAANQRVLSNPAVQRGREIIRRNCAGCHSVSLKAPSLNAGAPPLRELGDRHTPESLRAAVGADHYGMPPMYLSAEDARALAAFPTAFAHADKDTRRRLSLPSCFLRRC